MKSLVASSIGAVVLAVAPAGAATVFSAAGADPAAIQLEVDAFRAALGELNPNEPTNFADGRRQINWDAAPDAISDPNPFPGDFFNADVAPRARGIEFSTPGTGFLLSATEASGQPPLFGFPDEFQTFSPERLFAPIGSAIVDVDFFDPAMPTRPATTTGLGVVFVDVEADDAMMTFLDEAGDVLAQETVPQSGDQGLAFLGVAFDDAVVAGVEITTGGGFLLGNGVGGTTGGAVVMDDFIFGEPAPVPLPGGVVLLGGALASLAAWRRRPPRGREG